MCCLEKFTARNQNNTINDPVVICIIHVYVAWFDATAYGNLARSNDSWSFLGVCKRIRNDGAVNLEKERHVGQIVQEGQLRQVHGTERVENGDLVY